LAPWKEKIIEMNKLGANLPGVEKDLFEWLASAYLCLRGIYMEENFDIVNISHQTTYYRIQREAYG
jgi:hypothetical protein